MAVKIRVHNGQCVKRELHKPCARVARAAARFVKYEGDWLRMSFRQESRFKGRCQGPHGFTVRPPNHPGGIYDPLYRAVSFFETCAHETCHCQDNLECKIFPENWDRERQKAWANRPEEIAVFDRLYDLTGGTAESYIGDSWFWEVKLPKYVQNAVLELALVLDDVLDYPEGCSTVA